MALPKADKFLVIFANLVKSYIFDINEAKKRIANQCIP